MDIENVDGLLFCFGLDVCAGQLLLGFLLLDMSIENIHGVYVASIGI